MVTEITPFIHESTQKKKKTKSFSLVYLATKLDGRLLGGNQDLKVASKEGQKEHVPIQNNGKLLSSPTFIRSTDQLKSAAQKFENAAANN